MKLEELKSKKILIVGYGLEGKATKEFLLQKFPDAIIGIVDKKDGDDYLAKQGEYDLAIKSPGVKSEEITIPYTTATNIFFGNVIGTVIGITGSKGKSTVSTLVYEILKAAEKKVHLVGNIGKPALAELTRHPELVSGSSLNEMPNQVRHDNDHYWVYELSSFMLSDIEYSPHISVITNLFPEHMDYHGGAENYYKAKEKIVAHSSKKNFFVYNQKVDRLVNLAKNVQAKAIPIADLLPFSESIITLKGQHNIENVSAAVTVAKLLHIDEPIIEEAVKNFKALKHRLEFVGKFNGISFYDDAIATNPVATIRAIESLPDIGTIFLGGQDRGWDFSELVHVIKKYNISNVVLFPDSGAKIKTKIEEKLNPVPKMFETDSMEGAVQWAYKNTPSGKICLLSCASPSFSLWKNYEEKGDLFQKFVNEYGKLQGYDTAGR
jgi:UDP-N-acetylmuramoyl-L-alanine---L-glutamate ligase